VLGQHVEAGRPRRIAVELARLDGLERRQRFQHLEAVGRRDHGAAGLVEPMVGAADPLHQAAHALGRAHLDHQVDVAPVDAEIERGVATTARSLPAAIAASTLRRCSTASEP
jgi:hypothetical protein